MIIVVYIFFSCLYFAFDCQGTATVQAIFFNMSEIGQLHLHHADFKKMYNLRLLHVDNSRFGNYWDLEVSLPNSLSYLCWVGYQLKSLPSEFSPKNLVELRMSYSNVEQLWNEGQVYMLILVVVQNVVWKVIQVKLLTLAISL